MPNLLLDVVAYLKAQAVIIDDGNDCFRDSLPDNDANEYSVGIFEYAGNTIINSSSADRNIQVRVRSKKYETARQKSNQIYAVLHDELERVKNITAERWCVIYANQPPYKLLVDESGRTVFVANYNITTYVD